jgi:hypothetical protein
VYGISYFIDFDMYWWISLYTGYAIVYGIDYAYDIGYGIGYVIET